MFMNICSIFNKLFKALEIIFIIIILLLLVLYAYIMINSKKYPNKIPDIFGYKPLIVLSGSMEPEINKGDLIFAKEISHNLLKEGDIIAYRTNDDKIVTHRINKINIKNNKKIYITKGDNNNTVDNIYLIDNDIEGIYISKIPKLGNVLMFIRKPLGLIVCLLSIGIIGLAYIIIKNYKKLNVNYEDVKN